MSSTGISFGGLASGLDTKAIIAALMGVERRPLFQLEAKKKAVEQQRSLYGDFEKLLAKLKTESDSLRKTASFVTYKATLDSETFLSATAGQSAVTGTYDLRVESLAKSEVRASAGRASQESSDFSGEGLVFTINGQQKIVNLGGATSLQGIASAINNSEAAEALQAQVLNTGDPANPYKLVVSSRTAGEANRFTVSTDGGNAALDTLVGELNGTPAVLGTDAVFHLNGIPMRRTSNTITDAIQGVTLTLKGETGTGPATKLTVSADSTATAEKVKKFVDAYNAIVDFIETQNKVGEKGAVSGPLFGDSSLRSIRSTLRDIAGSSVDTGNSAIAMLAQVGISGDRAGRLTFEQGKFEKALNEGAPTVRDLFAKTGDGIAGRVYDRVHGWTDSVEGLLKSRKDGFESRIRQANTQIERTERRLTLIEAQLNRKYAALETQLGRLQSQGGALGALQQLGQFNQNRR